MKATEWSKCFKGNSTNIRHQNVFAGPAKYFCMCEKEVLRVALWLQRKLDVNRWTASSDITQSLSGIVGHFGNVFKKKKKKGNISGSAVSVLNICFQTVNIESSSVTAVQHWTSRLLSETWCPHYPQCNKAPEWHRWRLKAMYLQRHLR